MSAHVDAVRYHPPTDDGILAAAYNDGYQDGYSGANRQDSGANRQDSGANRQDSGANDESLWYEIGYNDGEDASDDDHWSIDYD